MKSVIIGAGTYGQVYLSYLREAGVEVVGFLDDDPALESADVCGVPVLGPASLLKEMKAKFGVEAVYCPLGNNRLRVKFLSEARSLGYATPNFIHHTVYISPDVTIAEQGVYILPRTVILPYTSVSADVMIAGGSYVAHHTVLKQGVFISNGVNLGACVTVEECAWIGMGSTIISLVPRLGADCLVGAGAVVIRSVPDGAVVAGVPSKIIKYKPGFGETENQL